MYVLCILGSLVSFMNENLEQQIAHKFTRLYDFELLFIHFGSDLVPQQSVLSGIWYQIVLSPYKLIEMIC